jgi:hypothetical protein
MCVREVSIIDVRAQVGGCFQLQVMNGKTRLGFMAGEGLMVLILMATGLIE